MKRTILALFLTLFPTLTLANHLTPVVTNRVCMVTDHVFPTEQIPVTVDDKTYYGCCQGCKKTLETDASARTGFDPVTQKKVDKATAYIAHGTDGSVVYFENKATFEKYQKTHNH
ncbi:MAG: hypothetical protein AB7T49_20165 [Oligoflexales bacterium]